MKRKVQLSRGLFLKGFIGVLILGALLVSFTFSKDEISAENIDQVIKEAHEKFKGIKEGKNADYIPYLAKVDPNLFGIAIITADGHVHLVGDTKYEFGIESISKVMTLALAMQDRGPQVIKDSIGANATGLPFNSITALETLGKEPQNPMVNAGAIATTSIVLPKNNKAEKWKKMHNYFNKFAGREIKVIDELFKSEMETNQRNKSIAILLQSYNRIFDDPMIALELYTKQCSFGVNAMDLAVMAATLANSGVNPMTREKLVEAKDVPEILAVMSTAGLYENTGEWMYTVGLPAKSGVGGGIMAVVPGKMGIAVFAPPLDPAGNSVKAQKAIEFIADKLSLNLFSAKK
ncbi:MAG: glutaminase A [Sporocytophaga sp.]|uniref:glutaminase A n=1 Tax=Sporocytophaga sp. TaxID=2231183 RepID=UPI001B1FC3E6|nr:glutaminase A [Sporocytophaga sp.]MBO9702617.1 glutaminase A [Sporocytophaga sp.]